MRGVGRATTEVKIVERRTCLFSGRVQGVGFRYTVEQAARHRPVAGYVRNLPDGRVELMMEGSPRDLDELLSEIQQKMEGFIRETHCQSSAATGEFQGFEIRYR